MLRKSATHLVHNELPMMRARRLTMSFVVPHNTLVVLDALVKAAKTMAAVLHAKPEVRRPMRHLAQTFPKVPNHAPKKA